MQHGTTMKIINSVFAYKWVVIWNIIRSLEFWLWEYLFLLKIPRIQLPVRDDVVVSLLLQVRENWNESAVWRSTASWTYARSGHANVLTLNLLAPTTVGARINP